MVITTRWAATALSAWLAVSCTKDTYVVGALCSAAQSCPPESGPAAGAAGNAGGGGSAGAAPPLGGFHLDLTGSGVERLPQQLFGTDPSDLLIASDASMAVWKARVGQSFDVLAPGALRLGEPAPFADAGSVLSHSDAPTFSADSAWADISAGAIAVELVFRGEPGARLLTQRDSSAGLELSLNDDGRLQLRLDGGASEVTASSPELVPDAWHHCLVLLDTSQLAAQLLCNGQAGAAVTLPTDFAIPPVVGPTTLGGVDAARVHWAQLARWRAPSWAPRGAWLDAARERFTRLVGTYAAGGPEPLPFADVRASGAYIDMTANDAPELRRLHPVGAHWPRIVCRPTSDSPRTCGLLVEGASSQPIAPSSFSLDNWETTQLELLSASAVGPTGAPTLYALSPSVSRSAHHAELTLPFGDGPAVFSMFARPGKLRRLRAEASPSASATFDISSASVLETTGTRLSSAEAWGDGLVRLSFSFDVEAGPGRLRIAVLAEDEADAFVGDGSAASYVGDVELRFRSFAAPLPTFGAIQQSDRLVYPAGNGNLAGGPRFALSAEVWLPDAPLLDDAAIVNANFAGRFDQQINVFVRPLDGTTQFFGRQGTVTPWQVASDQRVTDGVMHRVIAEVGVEGASLSVDGRSSRGPAGAFDTSVLDRVEIGSSTSSSGALTGIVRRISIATPAD